MGFKRGMIIGFGVGYVLGSKAGRERYDELKAAWDRFTGNPTVANVLERGREVVEAGKEKGLHVVDKSVNKATGAAKKKIEGENEEGWQPVKN